MIEYKSYLYSGNSVTDPVSIISAGGAIGSPMSLVVTIAHVYTIGELIYVTGLGDTDPGVNEKIQRFNGLAKVTSITPVGGTNVIEINKKCQYLFSTSVVGNIYRVSAVEVFPLNLKECEKRKELQQGEFFYREKLSGSIKFANRAKEGITDYTYLSGIEDGANRCSLFLIDIYRKCQAGEAFELFFSGQFTLNDGFWDRDSCFYETEISPNDIYSCLFDNNEDVNILDVETWVETVARLEASIEYIECDGFNTAAIAGDNDRCPPDLVALYTDGSTSAPAFVDDSCITPGEWWIFKTVYTTVTSTPTFVVNVRTTWFRQVETTLDIGGVPNSPPGTGWYVISATDIGGQPATKWGRDPLGGSYVYAWSHDCGDLSVTGTAVITNPVTYSRNRWLFGALEHVAGVQCGAINGVKSDFFEWNPPGDTPGYVAGTNYVTGLTNQYNLLTIGQTSDFVGVTTEAATKGMIKIKNFLDLVKEMFNCGWWITADNYIRFEHVSAINKIPGLNFVTLDGGKWIKRNNKYKWKKDGMVSQETYWWSQAKYEDFIGRPIVYTAECLNKKASESEKRHDLTMVTTDLRFIQNSPLESIKTGFVILANEEQSPGVYEIINYTGVITQQLWNNAPLSWANLHDNLHRHYRITWVGKMNGFSDVFMSVQRFKAQDEFSYLTCCNEDSIGEEITTQLGIGWLESMSLSLKSAEAKLNLLFGESPPPVLISISLSAYSECSEGGDLILYFSGSYVSSVMYMAGSTPFTLQYYDGAAWVDIGVVVVNGAGGFSGNFTLDPSLWGDTVDFRVVQTAGAIVSNTVNLVLEECVPPCDADAQAFLDAAGITDVTISDAICQLATDLKAASLWDKMDAIYPMVGGTATTHKFNLKNPVDSDAAFRLTFSGGWSHDANGAQSNGTNGAANTHLNPSLALSINSSHLSFYDRLDKNSSTFDAVADDNAGSDVFEIVRYAGTLYYAQSSTQITTTSTYTKGFYLASRTSSIQQQLFYNSTTVNTSSAALGSLPNKSVYYAAYADGSALFAVMQLAFASIGSGLSAAEANSFYNIIQTFQTSLSRNI